MRWASPVADVYGSRRIYEDAVRTRKLAEKWIRFRAVAALAGSENRRNEPGH